GVGDALLLEGKQGVQPRVALGGAAGGLADGRDRPGKLSRLQPRRLKAVPAVAEQANATIEHPDLAPRRSRVDRLGRSRGAQIDAPLDRAEAKWFATIFRWPPRRRARSIVSG